MEKKWLKEEVAKRGHGAQVRLAEHLGIAPSVLNKLIRGTRKILATEADKIRDWLELNPVDDGKTPSPATPPPERGGSPTLAAARTHLQTALREALKRGPTRRKLLKAAGIPPNAQIVGPHARQVEVMRKLANAASAEIGQRVTVDVLESQLAELAREDEAPRPREVAVRSYVGAGDEIIPFDDEEPLYWTPAPPGLEDAEATQVRGASMFPAYEDGDVLFHRRHDGDPTPFLGRVVILQTRSRKRYVKVLQAGTKRGHFDLVSFNRLSPTIENQQLLWVAPILWVKKRQRF